MNIYYCTSPIIAVGTDVIKNVRWFRYDKRRTPIDNYEDIIVNYRRLRPAIRILMEDFVDEHLTVVEVAELERYLRTIHNWEMTLYIEPTPTRYVEDLEAGQRTQPVRYYTTLDSKSYRGIGFYKLSKEIQYSLPFKVWGYYNPLAQPQYRIDHGLPPLK